MYKILSLFTISLLKHIMLANQNFVQLVAYSNMQKISFWIFVLSYLIHENSICCNTFLCKNVACYDVNKHCLRIFGHRHRVSRVIESQGISK